MDKWKDIILKKNANIKDAMHSLNHTSMRIALICDEEGKLLGTVTDGDIRRGLLKGLKLEDGAATIMNINPMVASPDQPKESTQRLLESNNIFAIPIVDNERRVIGLETPDSVNSNEYKDIDIIIMAGGFGKRLGLLTKDTPKPMLSLGSKPILEHIIEDYTSQGFKNFWITTYYKADIIQNYFKDGSAFNCTINYIQEPKPLGTAGSLSLLKDKVTDNFIVMNADLLTRINFKDLIDFHLKNNSIATMCVKLMEHQIPYGVVELDEVCVKSIKEKPVSFHYINAGVYCLNKQVFNHIGTNEYLDMTSLFQNVIMDNEKISAYPIHEFWLDIGRVKDYQMAIMDK